MRFRSIVMIAISLLCLGILSGGIKAGERDQTSLCHALTVLQDALVQEGESVELLCLLAETHFYYGDWLQGAEQLEIWRRGEQYAHRALELDPSSAHAHYWVAATLGKIGRAQGILKSLFLVNPMLQHLESALAIDGEYSWAHYALSYVYDELPPRPLGRGDRALALAYAKTAWELEPKEPEFVLQYARLLIKDKQEKKALQLLRQALYVSSVRWTTPLYAEAENLARRLAGIN